MIWRVITDIAIGATVSGVTIRLLSSEYYRRGRQQGRLDQMTPELVKDTLERLFKRPF